MPVLRLVLNIIWVLAGGLEMALGWWLAAVLAAVSIVGIPWARACFNIGLFVLWPFGSVAVNRDELTGVRDWGTGAPGCIGNVVWFVLVGWWLALAHLILACLYAVTLIGIPFALQHAKLAVLAVAPVGKAIVPVS